MPEPIAPGARRHRNLLTPPRNNSRRVYLNDASIRSHHSIGRIALTLIGVSMAVGIMRTMSTLPAERALAQFPSCGHQMLGAGTPRELRNRFGRLILRIFLLLSRWHGQNRLWTSRISAAAAQALRKVAYPTMPSVSWKISSFHHSMKRGGSGQSISCVEES